MTAALTQTAPLTVPDCPTWCTTLHDPYGEVRDYLGDGHPAVAPRGHHTELHHASYTPTGRALVELTRWDYTGYDESADPGNTRIGLALIDTHGVEINLAPTPRQARALAAALLHAADLSETP